MKRSLVVLSVAGVGLLAGSSCNKTTPCVGAQCLQVAGTYIASYDPVIKCIEWAYHSGPTGDITMTQTTGSSVTVNIQPSADSPNHVFTGTQDALHNLVADEAETSPTLHLPYGSLTGNFTSVATGILFSGVLSLHSNGSTAGAVSGDGGAGDCDAQIFINAQLTNEGTDDSSTSTGSTSGSSGSTSTGSSSTGSSSTGTSSSSSTGGGA